MKLEELLKDEKIKEEIGKVLKEAKLEKDEDVLKAFKDVVSKHGVEASVEEIKSHLTSKMPISEDDLDKVAGGSLLDFTKTLLAKASLVSVVSEDDINTCIR